MSCPKPLDDPNVDSKSPEKVQDTKPETMSDVDSKSTEKVQDTKSEDVETGTNGTRETSSIKDGNVIETKPQVKVGQL